MILSLASLFVCLLIFLFCMLIRPDNELWTRLARVRLSDPLTPRSTSPFLDSRLPSSAARVQARRASMFRKAVDSFDASAKAKNALEKQAIPSSPIQDQNSAQLAIKQSLSASFRPPTQVRPLQQAPSDANNGALRKPNHGVKRSANGLAKSLYGSSQHSFTESKSFDGTTNHGFSSAGSQSFKKQSFVDFTEDDFDDDIELDIEEPQHRPSVTYPKLPAQPSHQSTNSATQRKVTYPSVQRSTIHTQTSASPTTQNEPASSVPYPWSSSPIEHLTAKAARPNHQASFATPKLTKKYEAIPEVVEKAEAAEERPFERAAPPAKRRTLPWLQQKQQEEAASNASESTPSEHLIPPTTPGSFFWDTTGSAIKKEQKKLRELNSYRKAAQAQDAAADDKLNVLSIKKPIRVSAPCLSNEQRQVLDLVTERSESVFFTGSAGTGKSVLLREIIAVLRKKYSKEPDRIAVTASTGLAACNVGGVTLHSFSGIGLGKEDVETLLKKIKRNQKAKHRWMRTKVLVIDEVSMVDGELFDKLEQIARTLRNNGRPFGGIQLVITGDFFQLPPVPDHGRSEARFCFDASTWTSVIKHTIALHHVFRQRDQSFADMLNEMRLGNLTQKTISAFRGLDRPIPSAGPTTELFPRRQDVEAANNGRMGRLAGELVRFEARDAGTIVDKMARDKLLQNCMAPEYLELKKGAQVMLIKNIDETLVNGSLGQIIAFMDERMFDTYTDDPANFASRGSSARDDDDSDSANSRAKPRIQSMLASTSQKWPVVRFQLADGTTRDLLCQRESWKVELPNGEVQASRSQIPLILAWALSIHKAQGQTLERVKVDLTKVFEKGQAYVALSRATSMAGLQVIGFNPDKVLAHPKVRNFYASLKRAEETKQKRTPIYDIDD